MENTISNFEERVESSIEMMEETHDSFSEKLEVLFEGCGYPSGEEINFIYNEEEFEKDYTKMFGAFLAYCYQNTWERIRSTIIKDGLDERVELEELDEKFSYKWDSNYFLRTLSKYNMRNISDELYIHHSDPEEFFEDYTIYYIEDFNEEGQKLKSNKFGKIIRILFYFAESYQVYDVLNYIKEKDEEAYKILSMKIKENFNYEINLKE